MEDELKNAKCVIKIYRRGDEVIATNTSTGATINTKYWEDDENDYHGAIKRAVHNLLNLNKCELKVGDKVNVIDAGKQFMTYIKWVEEHILTTDKLRFDYDMVINCDSKFKIKYIAPHLQESALLAFIEDLETGRCYLMGVEGLAKC